MSGGRIYAGSDHAGFKLKQRLIAAARARGLEVVDLGPEGEERVDYPDYGLKVARAVAAEPGARGLLCCGSGIGIGIAANKVRGVRAVTAWSEESARLSRQHNDANVLALGQRLIDEEEAVKILAAWLDAEFEGGRHAERVAKLDSAS